MRHLAADVAVKEEFIAFLGAELDDFGAADLASRGYRALRAEVGRLARRNARLGGAVEALKARIGERTSQ